MLDRRPPLPYAPAPWEDADITAIQALERGEASPEQQKRALKWIIDNAAQTHDVEYRSEPHDHAFCSGRRFVGLQIIKAIKLNLRAFNNKGSRK